MQLLEMTKSRESSDPYYDLVEDFDLIISSFQSQYGIRLSRDLRGMKWTEFSSLLSGLGPDTPLGRIVAIRSEDDEDLLKHFNKDQMKIRNKWRSKMAKNKTEQETMSFLEDMKKTFISMAGGANEKKES